MSFSRHCTVTCHHPYITSRFTSDMIEHIFAPLRNNDPDADLTIAKMMGSYSPRQSIGLSDNPFDLRDERHAEWDCAYREAAYPDLNPHNL